MFVELIVEAINRIPKGKIHRRWKESRTTMLQKCPKPGYKDWRPIAVETIINKVVCGYYRESIEDHMETNKLNHEIQYGFTKGGKVDFCLFHIKLRS